MTRNLWVLLVLVCLVVMPLAVAHGAAGDLWIACEGTESGGGGGTSYQYTLINNGTQPVTLTLFYVGTQDLSLANYTAWNDPAGFSHVVADWATLASQYGASVMSTTNLKTAHGVVPPAPNFMTAGGVLWTGSAVLQVNQTITFGFNHPNASVDVEWFAEHPDAANSSQGFPGLAIAGPVGVYTAGYVHGPGTEPVPVKDSTWGGIKALYHLDG
jgi:hypothetical protein